MNQQYWQWAKARYDPWRRFWLDQKPIPFVVDPYCPTFRYEVSK